MQKLKVFQSLWAMELRNPGVPERTHEEAFGLVEEAGYHGMCIDPSVEEIPAMRRLLPLYERFNLECMVNAFPFAGNDMQPLFELASDANAALVNAISGVMPIRPEDSVPVIRRWLDEAAAANLTLLFETHRDSLLNDLYYTLQVMDFVPEMRMCADLSHFVVDREMREPISALDQSYVDRILDRSDCFQGRVANREQVQIQLDFPQHQEWVEIFKAWWKQGMRRWRARNGADATLIFLCELGPPPYAITDRNQHELSDRWEEALQIRCWVEKIWADLDTEDSQGET